MDGRGGRGQAGEVDPADQWVFNPYTGGYELQQGPQPAGLQPQPQPPGPQAPRQPYEPRLPSQRRRRGEPPAPPEGPRSRRKPKPPKSTRKKVLLWSAGVLAFVLVAGAATAFYLYQKLNGNISKVEVAGEDHDAVIDGPVNILIIGTDARTGEGNEGYGDMNSPGHADTTLLFHVSEDRTNATVLSIPRDLVTDVPDCKVAKDGEWESILGTPGARFNESLGQSGRDPGCTWKTTEKLTGLDINHFLMADFNAVKDLSSAVGGVEVCVAKDIDDPKSHLKLSKGRHTIEGEDALAFVRTRYTVGFGSDLSRIELQQQFLGSLIRKMKSGGTLTNPKKLYSLASAATKSLTVDKGIGSGRKLMDLANDLKSVPQKNITFATLPVLDNPDDPATVVLDEAKAGPLFKMLQADKSMSGGAKPGQERVAKADPAEVRVAVKNGGAQPGMALRTAVWLQDEKGVGYADEAGNVPRELDTTRLEYAPDQAGQAAAVSDMLGLPKKALRQTGDDSGTEDAMTLILGKDYESPGTPIEAPDKAPEGVQNVKADDKDICAK